MNKKYIMVLILISVLFVSAGFFWISSSDSSTVRVGEYQTYGVYWENEEIGGSTPST